MGRSKSNNENALVRLLVGVFYIGCCRDSSSSDNKPLPLCRPKAPCIVMFGNTAKGGVFGDLQYIHDYEG